MDPWAELRQILEQPLPEPSSILMRSLSWNKKVRPADPISSPSFQVSGGIQLRETHQPPLPSTSMPSSATARRSPLWGDNGARKGDDGADGNRHGLSPNSCEPQDESLHDVEGVAKGSRKNCGAQRRKESSSSMHRLYARSHSDLRFARRETFPPPISTIGRGVKPWIYLKSFKKDGRFVLKRVKVPTQQCLQVTRENGRLLLQLAHPSANIVKREEKGTSVEQQGEEKGEGIEFGKRNRDFVTSWGGNST